MIITRAPLRITLGGGGTDLPSYYRHHGGSVFAMGIDKYMYMMVNRPIVDRMVRLRYSRSEAVARASDLDHDLARAALRHHGIEDRIEISSMADLPGGTGLGSSGAYLVGLLAALHRQRGQAVAREALAAEACFLEMDVLGKSVGKQDQYMAALGGLTLLQIGREGAVTVERVSPGPGVIEGLVANTHLYYTGVRRSAAEILRDQDQALAPLPSRDGAGRATAAGNRGVAGETDRPEGGSGAVADALHRIKDLGGRILASIQAGDLDGWGRLLHEHWEHKKRLSDRISLKPIDELYEHVRVEYGVLGGKIAGAGGGGFLMLYCPSGHARLEAFMADRGLPRLHYALAPVGVEVLAAFPDREGKGVDPGRSESVRVT